jgi:hypothetical protein
VPEADQSAAWAERHYGKEIYPPSMPPGLVDKPGWWIFLPEVPREEYTPPRYYPPPLGGFTSKVVDISLFSKGLSQNSYG